MCKSDCLCENLKFYKYEVREFDALLILQGLERKLSAADKAPSGYQPFSTTHPEEEIHESRVKVKVSWVIVAYAESKRRGKGINLQESHDCSYKRIY